MIRNRASAEFATTVALLLRVSRRRQRLTQAEVSARTGGVVSKAALANYETGHRSLRIEVFWALARALGEDAGALLAEAERDSGMAGGRDPSGPVIIDVAALLASTDARLAPVQRWLALRTPRRAERIMSTGKLTLDAASLAALAEVMGMDVAEAGLLLGDSGAAAVGSSDDEAPPSS